MQRMTLVEMLMEWVAPVTGGVVAGLVGLELGAPWWAGLVCALVGAFAGQVVMVGTIIVVGWGLSMWTGKPVNKNQVIQAEKIRAKAETLLDGVWRTKDRGE